MPDYSAVDAGNGMMLVRASAIASYTVLEASMCHLFTSATGMDQRRGGLVFFRMVNAKSRLTVLETLWNEQIGPEFKPFTKAVLNRLRRLDGIRNQIVHWSVVQTVSMSNGTLDLQGAVLDAHLQRPDYWWQTEKSTTLTIQDILDFGHEAQTESRALNVFPIVAYPHLSYPEMAAAFESWRDIFLQPLLYPLPEGHPLYTPREVWRNPLQPSQA
jgi:hypothetical protein